MPLRSSTFVAHLLVSGSVLLAGCASPAAAPADGTTAGASAPRLTVLAAAPGGAPPLAAPAAAPAAAPSATTPAPLAHGDLFAPPPSPNAELDLAAFRGQVVWITFFAADC